MADYKKLLQAQYAAIAAINEIVMQGNDADAHNACIRVREHLDARIEQTAPLPDPNEDLL